MGQEPLPGVQARYSLVPADGAARLRFVLEFDAAKAGPREAVRKACETLLGHLNGGPAGVPPPARVALSTSVAAEPLVGTADGGSLREQIAGFVEQIVATLAGEKAPPAILELDFRIDPGWTASLASDVFELVVLLDLGKDAFGPGPGDPPAPALPSIVTASPLLAEDGLAALVAFAAAVEQAWDGFDGAGGVLKLAAAPALDPPVLWCARMLSKEGIEIATAPAAGTRYHAVPPLSTVLLSGTTADPQARLTDIDLDLWWGQFVAEFERVSAPAMAAAIRAVSGEAADRLAALREPLARALAARLAPIAADPAGEAGPSEMQAVFQAAAMTDLACRSPVAGVAVTVGRGADDPGDCTPVLGGKAISPPEAAGAATALPAALRLQKGEQRLACVVPAPREGKAQVIFSARFDGEWLDDLGERPLRFLLPAVPSSRGVNPLRLDLGEHSAPVPLIAAPSPPAVLARAAAAFPEAATAAEALTWAVEAEIGIVPAAQDRLELTLGRDPAPADARPADAPASADLFDALARFVRLAALAPLEADGLDPAALERFVALASAVADALPRWQAPPASALAPATGEWRYSIDFAALPRLIVARAAEGSQDLPPWPSIAGYAAPATKDAVGEYAAAEDAASPTGLRIAIPGLRLPAARTARLAARVHRNDGLPGLAAVNPAFVFRTRLVSSHAVVPQLDWQAPEDGAVSVEPTLAAALDRLFAPLGEGAPAYLLAVAAELFQPAGADAGPDRRLPLLLLPAMRVGSGQGETGLVALQAELAKGLAAGRDRLDPALGQAEIRLTLELWDKDGDRAPLARLRQLRIRVPAGDAGWWGAPA
jgi:hypothetical protein